MSDEAGECDCHGGDKVLAASTDVQSLMSSGNCAPDDDDKHWTSELYMWAWRNRRWFRIIATVIIVGLIAFPTYAIFHHFGFRNGTPIAQELAAFAAIIVGASWAYIAFVRNRQKYPRANTSMTIQELPLPNGSILLKVINEIENIGNVLLSVNYISCSVYQVMPWPSEEVIWNSVMIEKQTEIDYKYKGEGNDGDGWPCLRFRDMPYGKDNFELEPGEKDNIIFDMVVKRGASLVRIYTYVQNVRKRRQNDLGWSSVVFYRMGVDNVQEKGTEKNGKNARVCEG